MCLYFKPPNGVLCKWSDPEHKNLPDHSVLNAGLNETKYDLAQNQFHGEQCAVPPTDFDMNNINLSSTKFGL